jgi:outer membrane protein assembly factor BamB
VSRTSAGALAVALLLLAATIAGPAAGAGAAGPVDWPQFHGGPTHRGVNPLEREVGAREAGSLSLSWIGNGATTVPDLVYRSSPTVVDGVVYFGTEVGQLLAFPARCPRPQCEPLWRVALGQSIYNTPAVVNGLLYVGTASRLGRLWAFDVDACGAGDCRPKWTARVAVGESSPTVADGFVFVGSQERGVHAFLAAGCGGPTTCDPVWVGETGGAVLGSPAVANGLVYVGASDGRLYAFDAYGCGHRRCQALFVGRAGGPILTSSPAVAGGVVYVASHGAAPDSHLEAFSAFGCGEATVCDPLWRGTGGHYLNSSPAVAGGTVFVGSGDGTLLAWPAAGCGTPACPPTWVGDAAGPVATTDSSPMVANGVVYIGENQGRVYAFRAAGCGRSLCGPLWEFITQDPIVNSSPVMVNGTLYLTGTNFSEVPILYVFEPVASSSSSTA